MNLDRGMLSLHFATNSEENVCEFENPYVLITSKRICDISSIIKLLEGASKNGRPLFIIADDIEGEALSTLIINRLRGAIKVCAIKSPGFGDKCSEILEDIAVITGGQVVSDETGERLEELDVYNPMIGSVKHITYTKDSTRLISATGKIDEIMSRIRLIQSQIAETDSEYFKEKLQDRLTNLTRSLINDQGPN